MDKNYDCDKSKRCCNNFFMGPFGAINPCCITADPTGIIHPRYIDSNVIYSVSEETSGIGNMTVKQVFNNGSFTNTGDTIQLRGGVLYLVSYTVRVQATQRKSVIINPIVNGSPYIIGTTFLVTVENPSNPLFYIATATSSFLVNASSVNDVINLALQYVPSPAGDIDTLSGEINIIAFGGI